MSLTVQEDTATPEAPPLTQSVDVERPEAAPECDFYRVRTPVEEYAGVRVGQVFEHGEAIVRADARVPIKDRAQADASMRVVDVMRDELGYSVEPIPAGVPPVPSYVMAKAGIEY